MKFHWGTRIFLIYGLFVAGVLAMVIYFMNQDVDLITEDYYKDEIKYQERIDKINRTKELSEDISFIFDGRNLKLKYPGAFSPVNIKGNVLFYRPSDLKEDVMLNVKPDTAGLQAIDVSGLKKGMWKVQVDWMVNNTSYYSESIININ